MHNISSKYTQNTFTMLFCTSNNKNTFKKYIQNTFKKGSNTFQYLLNFFETDCCATLKWRGRKTNLLWIQEGRGEMYCSNHLGFFFQSNWNDFVTNKVEDKSVWIQFVWNSKEWMSKHTTNTIKIHSKYTFNVFYFLIDKATKINQFCSDLSKCFYFFRKENFSWPL